MRCLRCGYETQSREAFCGRCGAPFAPPTGSASSYPRQEQLYPINETFSQVPSLPPQFAGYTPIQTSTQRSPAALTPSLSALQQDGTPQIASDFHHGATEAFVLPPIQSGKLPIPAAPFQQQNFPDPLPYGHPSFPQGYGSPAPTPLPGIPYADAYRPSGPLGPLVQPGQQQNLRTFSSQLSNAPKSARGPRQQQTTILLACIALVVLIIGAIGASLLAQGPKRSESATHPAKQTAITVASGTTPTANPAPTQVAPTPTIAPTPVPEAGFVWCGVECAPHGFMDEFPLGWQLLPIPDGTGSQFSNTQQPDQRAIFKRVETATTTADQWLASEIQTNYASKPGYEAPSAPGPIMTIGGETWSSATLAYQGDTQKKEHVTLYVTVHQGKTFILDFQSPDEQFAQVSTAYYNIMIGKFQFIQTGTP